MVARLQGGAGGSASRQPVQNLTVWLEEAGGRGNGGVGGLERKSYSDLYRPEQVSASGDSWLRQGRPSMSFVDLSVESSTDSMEARRKVSNLVRSMRPHARDSNMSVVEACGSLAGVLARQADARHQFLQDGGLLVLLELLDTDNPKFLDTAMEVALSLSADTPVLEAMCLLGIVPAACRLAQQSWPTGLRARAALFMQQLCFASPATLQLLISCQGLKHLVALVNDNLAETGALTSTALSCSWRVLEAAPSAAIPMAHLCRSFAQFGLPARLVALIKQLLAPPRPAPSVAVSASAAGSVHRDASFDSSADDRTGRFLNRSQIAPSPRDLDGPGSTRSSYAPPPTATMPPWGAAGTNTEWLLEVSVNLLLLLAHGDAVVKSCMCGRDTLQNLLDTLERLQQPHVTKVLQAIRLLASEASVVPALKEAGVIPALVPFIARDREREAPRPQLEALGALHVLCKYNKRVHLEIAASAGATPHLCRLAKELTDKPPAASQPRPGAPGAQQVPEGTSREPAQPTPQQLEAAGRRAAIRALVVPMLIGMVSASSTTRAKLLAAGGLDIFLALLNGQDVQLQQGILRALDTWLEEDLSRVEPRLIKPDALSHLVALFAIAAKTPDPQALPQQLEVLKSMLTRSSKLAVALVGGGLVPCLLQMLAVAAPLLRARVLDIIRTLYEHYPRPKEFIMRFPIQEELRRLLASDMRGDDAVKLESQKLLNAFNINILL